MTSNPDRIRASAKRHGVPEQVALALAQGEGSLSTPATIGDHGTSFGPFQAHWGGCVPQYLVGHFEASQAWANSDVGIDYCMVLIAAAIAGVHDHDRQVAVAVRRFERPQRPGPEIAADLAWLHAHPEPTPDHAGRDGFTAAMLDLIAHYRHLPALTVQEFQLLYDEAFGVTSLRADGTLDQPTLDAISWTVHVVLREQGIMTTP